MKSTIFLTFLIVSMVAAEKTLLLDDFSSRDTTNELGWSWYYYSDVNNDGNSQILGTEQKPGGGYSGILYDTVAHSTDFCGMLEFLLGEPESVSFNDPFAGMGTDIAVPGGTVDLTGMTAVSFKARSHPALNICFELESAAVHNFAYHTSLISTDTAWNEYTVAVNDLVQPHWIDWRKELTVNEVIDSICKINWKIFHSDNKDLRDTGYLWIDSVVMVGIDNLPMKAPTHVSCRISSVKNSSTLPAVTMTDLLGRTFTRGTTRHFKTSGTVILNRPTGAHVHISP